MKAMAPSSASFFDLYSRTQPPPMLSLPSVKGPSIARTCPFESRTRVLAAVEASPPLTTIVPALTASSPSFAITSMNPLGGGPWFSECLTIIMNRIATPLLCIFVFFLQGCIPGRHLPGGQPCSTVTSNSSPQDRQLERSFSRPRHSSTIPTQPSRTSERTCPLRRSGAARIHHHQQPAGNLSLIGWLLPWSLPEVCRTRRRLPSLLRKAH